MKFNFKPLSSFFKSTATEENKENKEDNKAGENQSEAGNTEEEVGDEAGSDSEEAGDKTGESETTEAKSEKKATISISQAEFKAFVAADAELQKFGKTAEDRSNFLKDAAQLSSWYEAAKGVGATSKTDANATEKSKKVSKVTAEAKEAYEKSAATKK